MSPNKTRNSTEKKRVFDSEVEDEKLNEPKKQLLSNLVIEFMGYNLNQDSNDLESTVASQAKGLS